ncbi:MAG TPA: SAM-dependent methyltransferase, partial [Arenibaculum sp.]|nr:SAM-dependent methyltransferase [Arenibaculum sp.]
MSAGRPGGGNGLAAHLARRIRAEGPLSVAAWMAECLGNPRFGYYTTRDPLGRGGDFVTAPEISQTFGELIGLWCADTWTRMGAPSGVRLVELGPGRGTLMSDALRAARLVPAFARTLSIHLVETSPALRARQAAALGRVRPTWHDRLADIPEGPMLLVANEFFDALPIHQLQKTPRGWVERLVDAPGVRAADGDEDGDGNGDGAGLRFVLGAGPSPLARLVPPALRNAPDGSVFELCPRAASIAAEIGGRIARHGGAALIIDYGHAAPGLGDTLQAVRGHRYAPVLEAPGEADLTAHVDFAALADAARASGAAAYGPTGQGAFLVRLGIRERAARLLARAAEGPNEGPDESLGTDIASGVRRLIDEAGMGNLFKVLALAAPGQEPPAGL